MRVSVAAARLRVGVGAWPDPVRPLCGAGIGGPASQCYLFISPMASGGVRATRGRVERPWLQMRFRTIRAMDLNTVCRPASAHPSPTNEFFTMPHHPT